MTVIYDTPNMIHFKVPANTTGEELHIEIGVSDPPIYEWCNHNFYSGGEVMVARRVVQNQDKALIKHESRGRGCQGRALALIRGRQHPMVAFAVLTDHR